MMMTIMTLFAGFAMVLDRYGAVRIRFTWRNRSVNKSTPKTSQKVLADCKDQMGHGGMAFHFVHLLAVMSRLLLISLPLHLWIKRGRKNINKTLML